MFADKSSSFSTGKINKRPSFDPNAPAGMKIVPHARILDPDPRIFRSVCLEPEKNRAASGEKKKKKKGKEKEEKLQSSSLNHGIFAKFRHLKAVGIIKAQCESILHAALNRDSRTLCCRLSRVRRKLFSSNEKVIIEIKI